MLLDYVRLLHGPDPDPSGDKDIGFAIRYIPTYVSEVRGHHDSATLVRGEDRYHQFAPEAPPDADMSTAAIASHAPMTGAHAPILMCGTGRPRLGVLQDRINVI